MKDLLRPSSSRYCSAAETGAEDLPLPEAGTPRILAVDDLQEVQGRARQVELTVCSLAERRLDPKRRKRMGTEKSFNAKLRFASVGAGVCIHRIRFPQNAKKFPALHSFPPPWGGKRSSSGNF